MLTLYQIGFHNVTEIYLVWCKQCKFQNNVKSIRHSLDSNRTSDKHLNVKNVCLNEIELHASHSA